MQSRWNVKSNRSDGLSIGSTKDLLLTQPSYRQCNVPKDRAKPVNGILAALGAREMRLELIDAAERQVVRLSEARSVANHSQWRRQESLASGWSFRKSRLCSQGALTQRGLRFRITVLENDSQNQLHQPASKSLVASQYGCEIRTITRSCESPDRSVFFSTLTEGLVWLAIGFRALHCDQA